VDLELDEEQHALAEAVGSVLAREWPPTALRRLVEDGVGVDALWKQMVALDWPALCVPEADGGMGYGTVEAAIVIERCGAAGVPGPLLPTVALYAPLVRALADDSQRTLLLGRVAEGSLTGTAALGELTRRGSGADVDPAALTVTATAQGDRWHLAGVARSVIEADAVDHIAVVASLGGGEVGVFTVEPTAEGVTVEPLRSPDGSRRTATVTLDVAVDADAALGRPGEPGTATLVRRAVDESVTLLASELVGTCSTIFAMTLEHAKEREQFGVPIGSFQAIKHRLADAYLVLEAARASVLVAAAAVAEDDPRRPVAASTAKALAGDCADVITREGIQLLGGLGFTWEHDMHLFTKRAMSSSALLGTAEAHRQRVADLIGLVPV
jgi:alkylation response protein AidB-like acyl-CoA dehydrogenase